MSKEIITTKFDGMKIFGKKLTNHHKDLIFDRVRDLSITLINYMHYNGYIPIPHNADGMPRYWSKNGIGKYTESDIFYRMIGIKMDDNNE